MVVADIDAVGAERVARDIGSAGGSAVGVTADVAEEDDIAALIASTVSAFGRLDILHKNAALTTPEVLSLDKAVTGRGTSRDR